jgi:hypothetical protein
MTTSKSHVDWEKLIAGPLVEKWRKLYPDTLPESEAYKAGRKAVRSCADELVAHLRESGICEFIEKAIAIRDSVDVDDSNCIAFDAAKVKLLGGGRMMAIEELDDIAEELADKLGIYSEERSQWVAEFKQRIRECMEIERRLAAKVPDSVFPAPAWEMQLREWLWIAHGHGFGYGDDGEMQCSQCREWDYKRAPLDVLVPQALEANREANLKRLAAAAPPAESATPEAEAMDVWAGVESPTQKALRVASAKGRAPKLEEGVRR